MRRSLYCLGIVAILIVFMDKRILHRVLATSNVITNTTYATYSGVNLKGPTGLYINPNQPGFLFIADSGHNQIDFFYNGQLTVLAGSGSAGYQDGALPVAMFNTPLAISGPGYWETPSHTAGHMAYAGFLVQVYDSGNNVIRRICSEGNLGYPGTPVCQPTGVTTTAGSGNAGYSSGTGSSAMMTVPGGSSPTGATYFADIGNNAIRPITTNTSGATVTVGANSSSNEAGFVNGPLSIAKFNGPTSVSADSTKNSYVSDSGNFVIRKIDVNSNVTTFAGNGIQGYVDGPSSSAEFAAPAGSVYNPADGYLYVADSLNNSIRRISSSGTVSTYTGSNTAGFTNGTLAQARFATPTGLAICNGYMYVADTTNNAIRLIDMGTGQVSTLIH